MGSRGEWRNGQVYQLQDFFEVEAADQELLRHSAFLDRARQESAAGRDGQSRSALAAYMVLRLVDRLEWLNGSDEERDAFRWQLERAREHLSELTETGAESEHLQGIIQALTDLRQTSVRASLMAYAYYLEYEGRYDEALDSVSQTLRTLDAAAPRSEFPRVALLIARLNRRLARWERATEAYVASEAAAQELGDRASVLLSRIGRANVLRGQGDLPRARGMMEGVIVEATAADLTDIAGLAYSDLGVILGLQGLQLDSLVAQYRAFQHAPDDPTRRRLLGNMAVLLRTVGVNDVARRTFEMIAKSDGSFNVKTNALVELMDLESAEGDRVAFERRRQQLRHLAGKTPPSMAIDFLYKEGIGMARFGQLTHARRSLRQALAQAEEHHLNEWYFRVERVLNGLVLCPDSVSPEGGAARVEVLETPALAEVASGLQRYAEQSAR